MKHLLFLFLILFLFGCIGSDIGAEKPEPAQEEQPKPSIITEENKDSTTPITKDEIPSIDTIEKPQLQTLKEPCENITCKESEKCINGICYLKTCSEMNYNFCDGKTTACSGKIHLTSTEGQCCTGQCISIDYDYSISKISDNEIPHLRYIDGKGYYHNIPLYFSLPITNEAFSEFLFDDHVTYYYSANTQDNIIRVKNNDTLNTNTIQLTLTPRKEIKINNGPAMLKSQEVNINGIQFNIAHISSADWIDMTYRSSFQLCYDKNCTKFPLPFDRTLNNTLYLYDGAIYLQTSKPHIVLTGKNNARFGYLPIIVKRHNFSRLFLVFDEQNYIKHKTIKGTEIEFLGTDIDNNNKIDYRDVPYYAIDSTEFGNFSYDATDNKPLYAYFRIIRNNTEELVAIQT